MSSAREARRAFLEVVGGVAVLCAMALLGLSTQNPESVFYKMPATPFWGLMFTGAVTAAFLLTEATADMRHAESNAERWDRS